MTTPPSDPGRWYPDPNQPDPGQSYPQGPSMPKKRRQWPWLLGAGLAAGVALVTALNDDEAPSLVDQVVSSCQNAVAERAVAPSTVSFVSSELATTETGWTVSGQLDGQNVFGALIRAPYACDVQYTLEGEQASLRVFVVE